MVTKERRWISANSRSKKYSLQQPDMGFALAMLQDISDTRSIKCTICFHEVPQDHQEEAASLGLERKLPLLGINNPERESSAADHWLTYLLSYQHRTLWP